MSFGDHLEDLRRRLIWALAGVAVLTCVTSYYGRSLVVWLCQPLIESQRQLGLPQQTISLSVGGGFMVYMKVSVIAALALGAPWVIYQLWRFIRPGLYRNERRFVGLIAPFSAAMSALAIVFLYYLFLPAAISFLLGFSATYPPAAGESPNSLRQVTTFFNWVNSMVLPGSWLPTERGSTQPASTQPADGLMSHVLLLDHDPEHPEEGQLWFNRTLSELRISLGDRTLIVQTVRPSLMNPQIDVNEYLSLVVVFGLVLVISFQLPVVMTLLASVGLVKPGTLARYRKYIVFGCFVVGIFATPNQDLVSNVLFPLLLWGLFEIGLVAMRLVWKEREPEAGADDTGPLAS